MPAVCRWPLIAMAIARAVEGSRIVIGERAVRQRTAERMLDLARHVAHHGATPQSTLGAANMVVELVAADLLAFLEIDPGR